MTLAVSGSTGRGSATWRSRWPGAGATVETGRHRVRVPDRFVWLSTGFYERSVERNGEGTTVSLRPVSAATVLSEASRPPSGVPDPLARAVRDGGEAHSPREVSEAWLVCDGDRYYLAGKTGEEDAVVGRWTLSLLGSVAGLAALWRGHRSWVRYDDGDS